MKKRKKAGASPAKAPALGTMVGFVPSHDLERSKAFYTKVLGLRLREEDPFGLMLQGKGTRVRVAGLQGFKPAPFTVLGWETANIRKQVAGLTKKGIRFQHYEGMKQDNHGIWRAPGGALVAWFKDPDGNVLSLTQG